jgi:hydrogenase maturation protein HypF
MSGELIRIRGLVQGVGFRAAVERVARERGATGWVRNDGRDVLIALAGEADGNDAFVEALLRHLPPLSRIDGIDRTPAEVEDTGGFSIVPSRR